MTTRPHDALFKAAFEHPEHAGGLLRSILPASICAAVEWTTLVHEPGSFVDPQLSDRHSDLLFSAKLTGTDATVYFYLLLEHQSTLDPDMPRRMLGYAMSFWERHRKQFGGPLPIVFPILICHVPGGWTAATSMQELFEPSPDSIADLARYVPHVSLLVEDLAHLSNEDLRQFALDAFPMVALWLLRDARNPDALFANFEDWFAAFAAAVRAPSGMAALVQLLSYISWVCGDETYDRFRETIRKRLPEAEDTVITHAQKMIQKGQSEMLEKQLRLKFGAIESSYRTLIANATLEQLDRYAARILFAERLPDVFAD